MPKSEDILLVCYTFPPTPGIGGRRWAKFAKYLVKKDYRIHVLTAPCRDYPHKRSQWAIDVEQPDIFTYTIPDNYPHLTIGRNIFQKLRNHLLIIWLHLMTKGTPYDRAVFWRKNLYAAAKSILTQYDITHLIITGPPFYSFHHLLPLKKEFSGLNIHIDYRDPWTTAINYGIPDLSPKRLKFEENLETEVLQFVDSIITPYPIQQMLAGGLSRSHSQASLIELPHAYDPDDFSSKLATVPTKPDKIVITYGGALYLKIDGIMNSLVKALKELAQSDPDFYARLEFHLYSKDYKRYPQFQEEGLSSVFLYPPVPKEEIFAQVKASDLTLLLLADHNRHFRTTKFVEYLKLGNPFLLLGPAGGVSEYISEHQIGGHLTEDNLDGVRLKTAITSALTFKQKVKDMDLKAYSFEAVTNQLIELLSAE